MTALYRDEMTELLAESHPPMLSPSEMILEVNELRRHDRFDTFTLTDGLRGLLHQETLDLFADLCLYLARERKTSEVDDFRL